MRPALAPLLFGLPLACTLAVPVEAQTYASTATSTLDPIGAAIAEAAQRFALPTAWIRAIIRAESNGDQHATSPKGAMGLMQVMPSTWSRLRLDYSLGNDPYDPHDNIIAGAAFIRTLLDRYGSPGWVAAYNAGPGRYEAWLRGRSLPSETVAYVAAVTPRLDGDAAPQRVGWAESSLFIAQQSAVVTVPDAPAESPPSDAPKPKVARAGNAIAPRSNGLFVVRGGQGARP